MTHQGCDVLPALPSLTSRPIAHQSAPIQPIRALYLGLVRTLGVTMLQKRLRAPRNTSFLHRICRPSLDSTQSDQKRPCLLASELAYEARRAPVAAHRATNTARPPGKAYRGGRTANLALGAQSALSKVLSTICKFSTL